MTPHQIDREHTPHERPHAYRATRPAVSNDHARRMHRAMAEADARRRIEAQARRPQS